MALIQSVGVHIKVADFEKSRKFYLDLGFNPTFEYGPGLDFSESSAPEKYRGISFATPGGEGILEIADDHIGIKRKEVFKETVQGSKISLFIKVNDLYLLMENAKNAGIEIHSGPVNYHWGTTEIVIKDPDGAVLVFTAPTKEEDKGKYPFK